MRYNTTMLRITDQYFWNFVFSVFFLILLVMAAIILETESRIPLVDLALTDYVLVTLAAWRLTRLFVYDEVTRFIREQFLDVKKVGKSYQLEKPKTGPRRTLADLFDCPWCVGIWVAFVTLFVYLLTPYAVLPVTVLAIASVATFLQLLTGAVTRVGT